MLSLRRPQCEWQAHSDPMLASQWYCWQSCAMHLGSFAVRLPAVVVKLQHLLGRLMPARAVEVPRLLHYSLLPKSVLCPFLHAAAAVANAVAPDASGSAAAEEMEWAPMACPECCPKMCLCSHASNVQHRHHPLEAASQQRGLWLCSACALNFLPQPRPLQQGAASS